MKYDRPLDGILGTRSKVALLRLLLRTRGEHTGRELSRGVGLDAKTCHTALQELARQGVVEYRRAGAAHLYRPNERHILVEKLLGPLFQKEEGLFGEYARDLRRRIRGPILSVILFGSVARKTERPGSDVDVVLVAPTREAARRMEAAADQAAGELATRYGNAPQVLVFDRDDFRRKAESKDGFVLEVLRTGRVIKGKPFAELLRHVS